MRARSPQDHNTLTPLTWRSYASILTQAQAATPPVQRRTTPADTLPLPFASRPLAPAWRSFCATGSLRPSAALPGDDRTQAAAVGRSESPISYSVSSTHTNPYSQHTPIVKIYQIPHELCPSPGMPAISLHSSGRIWRRSTKSSQEHPPTELVLGHQTPNLLVSKKRNEIIRSLSAEGLPRNIPPTTRFKQEKKNALGNGLPRSGSTLRRPRILLIAVTGSLPIAVHATRKSPAQGDKAPPEFSSSEEGDDTTRFIAIK